MKGLAPGGRLFGRSAAGISPGVLGYGVLEKHGPLTAWRAFHTVRHLKRTTSVPSSKPKR